MSTARCCFSTRSAGSATGACGCCCGLIGGRGCVSRRCKGRRRRLICANTGCRRMILTAWCWSQTGHDVRKAVISCGPMPRSRRSAKLAASGGFRAVCGWCRWDGAIHFIAASRVAVMRSLGGGSRGRWRVRSGRRGFYRKLKGQRFLAGFFLVMGTTMTGQGAFWRTAWVVLPTSRS